MQLLTNAFELPTDGWYQISSLGEFPHNSTGLLQIIDDDSCRAMVDSFSKLSTAPNFPGILIDFDHFSLDHSKPSEAAGWITQLQQRPGGLWAQIRWSDAGEQAVKGGRYRFISPVWRQDECMDLGNKRVRPIRLINAAVTNDPNISGMVPLSNKREPAHAQVTIDITNRTSLHFRRGLLLGNAGIYFDPQSGKSREWIGGAPWGRGGGRGRGGGSAASHSSSGAGNQSSTETQPVYTPKRDSDARVAELQRQRDALTASAPTPPEKPDYSLTDTRALQREMMRQGKSVNEIRDAIQSAETQNQKREEALSAIRHSIAKKYVDPQRRRQELAKLLDKQDREHQKEVLDWQKQNRALDKKLSSLDAQINIEHITGDENIRGTAIRQNNEDAKQADRQVRELQASLRKQIEADKAETRRQEAAARAAAKAQKEPATQYRQELNRRRTYWQAAARGDWNQAQQIFPTADHAQNKRDLEKLVPPSKSKSNAKAYENALKQLQYEAP